jgi:putative nucleotidyltransferase-like protein
MRQTNNFARKPALDDSVPMFYREVIHSLTQGFIPILLGGGYALELYTHMGRHPKDMDIFVYRKDLKRILALLNRNGFRAELNFPHWLGKVYYADQFIDIIFSSGNGLCEVDPLWFKYAVSGTVFGLPIRICPLEEMIWSKAFIMERERFDGADVAHIILKLGKRMDWDRLLFRFGQHWRVLLSHLILFDYIYPSERLCVPQYIRGELFHRLKDETMSPNPDEPICRGPLLSRTQYQIDTVDFGYRDARIAPEGNLSTEEAASWTAAADTVDEKQ